MGRMDELDPEMGGGDVEMEVLKCFGQTESSVFRLCWGGRVRLVQEESMQRRRIWAIILFGLQGNHLFAQADMFLSSGGPVLYGKPIARKRVYLSCKRSRQTEQGLTELDSGKSECVHGTITDFEFYRCTGSRGVVGG